MNPARSLGSSLCHWQAMTHWIYRSAPFWRSGGSAALTSGGVKTYKGAPNDLYQALHDIEVKS